MSYRLFIDESGIHTYDNLVDPCRRYLGLSGVWMNSADSVEFDYHINKLKKDLFGETASKPVILCRNEILNKRGAFGVLVNADIEAEFNEKLLAILRDSSYKIICVVIDKLNHKDKYVKPIHPYHYCLAAMLDRYCGWMNYKNVAGDVMAESRGKRENTELMKAYQEVYENGTLMFKSPRHKRVLTSKEIKIRGKIMNTNGLQLADLLAQPIKQAMLINQGIDVPIGKFSTQIINTVMPKFNRNEWTQRVRGYGVVYLSM